jgi:hypothetical protein
MTAPIFDPLACGLSGTSDRGEQFELDASVNYVSDLVLFEIKATWLREEEFAPENSASLLRSLYRQYGLSEDGRKGTAQLAKIVNIIASGGWLGPRSEFNHAKRILPVLVVHDVLLGAPGFGRFVVSASGSQAVATSSWQSFSHSGSCHGSGIVDTISIEVVLSVTPR